MRYACRMGREVLDIAGNSLRVGVTTDEIDRIVHEACIERDCYPSPLNYYKFPKSVCTSVNEVICHGIPDYREIQDGDIVNIDVTTFCRNGFHADLNETFMVGHVDAEGEKLVHTAFDCLKGALAMVKPGTLYQDLGTTIQKIATTNGCSVNRTYCGHGIGKLFHTGEYISSIYTCTKYLLKPCLNNVPIVLHSAFFCCQLRIFPTITRTRQKELCV